MKCERCNGEFANAQLRVDANGGRLLCGNCFSFVKSGSLVPQKVKEDARKDFTETRKRLAMSTGERLDKQGMQKEYYQCKTCNYKFYHSPGFGGKCPYCAAPAVVPYAQEVKLKEIDDLF